MVDEREALVTALVGTLANAMLEWHEFVHDCPIDIAKEFIEEVDRDTLAVVHQQALDESLEVLDCAQDIRTRLARMMEKINVTRDTEAH